MTTFPRRNGVAQHPSSGAETRSPIAYLVDFRSNPVNGVPKQETVDVNADETFPVRNGSVNGVITVSPLSTLTCTGN
jgi:hypothetical protein